MKYVVGKLLIGLTFPFYAVCGSMAVMFNFLDERLVALGRILNVWSKS